jgi:hypothetical protein
VQPPFVASPHMHNGKAKQASLIPSYALFSTLHYSVVHRGPASFQ